MNQYSCRFLLWHRLGGSQAIAEAMRYYDYSSE
jgi:hypothetical protein